MYKPNGFDYFIVYGKDNCVWCDRAKDLLRSVDADWDFSNIETDPKEIPDFKALFPGASTVPQVFYGGKDGDESIGGYEALVAWMKSK